MPRAVSTGVGVYFGLMQLFFTLSWVIYVIFLPKLAAQAGIQAGVVPWILLLDQVIFALCDWLTGIAADRVANIVGRLGKVVAGVTALSALAFLLLPLATGLGTTAFLALVVIWAITSSALRAPPLKLLGQYTPRDQQPWVGSLFLLGIGIADLLAPFLAGWLTAYDPRIMFAASAASVVVVTFSIAWAEKLLARSAPVEKQPGGKIRSATFLMFLAAILLLAMGFQVHSFINAEPLFAKFAPPADLPALLTLFWIGFSLLMVPASWLTKRFGGIVVMALAALAAAASAWAAAKATDVVSLGAAQFVCGGAWGCVMMSAVAAALALGHTGDEGKAVGAMFSLMAVAAIARIALVAGHFQRVPVLALALPWLPGFAWLGAGLMLLPAVRRPVQRA
ncbi:MAG: MFS transporter [Mycobacteriaceae bacterium]|nr:MFS transporter [Mycobacteriaceae bacterium]MBV9638846.1 MFS transporter [Mycobacteriaceae bacterium]